MPRAIGKDDVATRYANLHDELKTAFGNKLVGADGTIADSGQTGFALAFNNDLIPPKNARRRQISSLKASRVATGIWQRVSSERRFCCLRCTKPDAMMSLANCCCNRRVLAHRKRRRTL
jgi:hypothetical protein